MFDYNNVTLIGRLVRDPELKTLNSGKTLANFTIAVQLDKQNTGFFDCTAWERTAQNLTTYCGKGNRILIAGKLIQQKFTDKNGNKRNKIFINTFNIQFLEPKKEKKADNDIPEPTPQAQEVSDFNTDNFSKGEDVPF